MDSDRINNFPRNSNEARPLFCDRFVLISLVK